jgi:hypothetical protein
MVESAPTGRALLRGRQLSLFKGKRQRGVAPPTAKEFALHCMVADMLRRWIEPGWQWTHIASGEKRDIITAVRLKRMGVAPGWPDLMFFHEDGPVAFLELKRHGSKQTEAQAALGDFLRNAGHRYNCVDNFDDAITTLKSWGILRAGIK